MSDSLGSLLFEKVVEEKVPILGEETNIHVHEAERIPLMINKNRTTSWHIIVNLTNLRAKELS